MLQSSHIDVLSEPLPARNSPAAGPQPFRLKRYFSITALLGLLVVLCVLLVFYRHFALTAIIEHEQRANEALTQVFANTIWPIHDASIRAATGMSKADLLNRVETRLLREDILQQMRGLSIVKVKIYDLAGKTVFSTDAKQIGEDKSTNKGFLKAKAGGTASEITFRNKFDAFEEVINDRNLVSSYLPVQKEGGVQAEAVMEVYSDVTELVSRLETTQWQIVGVVFGTLAFLYLFLYAIAGRADRIIKAQHDQVRTTHETLLRHQATHDALTSLPNRGFFSERLDLLLKVARRAGTRVAVLSLDVHGLKTVNQSLGHTMGDRVLTELGSRLRHRMREADITARRGGSEFAVALSNVRGGEQVVHVAEKIRDALCGTTYSVGGHELAVTMNIGIAIYPEDGQDGAALMSSADAAMHYSRTKGRNRYQFHSADMNERALSMLLTEQDLRQALTRNEFILHYQPQVHLATRRIVGAEALIRWQHPTRGLVPPTDFRRTRADQPHRALGAA